MLKAPEEVVRAVRMPEVRSQRFKKIHSVVSFAPENRHCFPALRLPRQPLQTKSASMEHACVCAVPYSACMCVQLQRSTPPGSFLHPLMLTETISQTVCFAPFWCTAVYRLTCTASLTVPLQEDYHMQHCLALVASHPLAVDSLSTLSKILLNIISSPEEPKYRQIRLGNTKVQA